MTTKEKGNIGESKIIYEFVKRGIQVSIPFGDNSRYDLIAEFNNKLNKIQIKYSSAVVQNGSINLKCRSSYNHTTNKHARTYQNDVDYIAFYIDKWDLALLVPIKEVGNRKTINFRKDATANGQLRNTHHVQDYLFDKIINAPIA